MKLQLPLEKGENRVDNTCILRESYLSYKLELALNLSEC